MNGAMNGRYILKDGEPVPCEDLMQWGEWMQTADRHVAKDSIGDVRVSTVFLGLDHSFRDGGPPLLFETMVFGGPLDQEQERYSTRDEAVKGHAEMVERVKQATTNQASAEKSA